VVEVDAINLTIALYSAVMFLLIVRSIRGSTKRPNDVLSEICVYDRRTELTIWGADAERVRGVVESVVKNLGADGVTNGRANDPVRVKVLPAGDNAVRVRIFTRSELLLRWIVGEIAHACEKEGMGWRVSWNS